MEAFRELSKEYPRLKLVVFGKRMRPRDPVDAAAGDPSLAGRVVQIESGTDEEIRILYAHARALLFPTYVEGFGLPPLEAMGMGVPSVCSDIPVIREVCGDAVRYADPSDPASIARQVRSALTDTERNGAYRERGRERVRRFERGKAIRQYLDLFRECLGKPGGTPPRGKGR